MKKLRNILLVDDDEITNFINQDVIMQMGITENVYICEDGKEAIEYLKKAYNDNGEKEEGFVPPDLIFLDLNMPVMNGFEFLKEFKNQFSKDEHCKRIIMLTTSLRDQDVEGALELKTVVSDYLEKPLTTEKVSSIIKQYFDFNFEG